MSYIGKTPTPAPLTSSDITDGIISLPKLTDGTDGNLISYDASGNPVAVATGSDGQVLTSAGAGAVPTFETLPASAANTPAFRAYRNGTQTVADVTSTVIQFNGESFDTDGAYNTSNYRFTVPSGKAGKYLFSAHIYIFSNGATLYSCDFQIRKNGANQSFDQLGLDSSDNYAYAPKTTTILDLSVGDYVDVNIIANTQDGGSFTVFGNSPYNYSVFQGYKLIG